MKYKATRSLNSESIQIKTQNEGTNGPDEKNIEENQIENIIKIKE